MVAIALNTVVFEQIEADLIVDKLPIRGILSVQRGPGRLRSKAFAPRGVKRALPGNGIETQVIEKGVKFDSLARLRVNMRVVPGERGARWRKCECIFHKLVAHRGEFLRCR